MTDTTVSAVSLVLARLPGEEGDKAFAYNDKTGKRVTCKTADPATSGNLSIGQGINLENGLDLTERVWLSTKRLTEMDATLEHYAWYAAADPYRQSVFLDVAYNEGLGNLMHFPHMLSAAAVKDWKTAAAQLLDSDAARELPHRYAPLAQILLNGGG